MSPPRDKREYLGGGDLCTIIVTQWYRLSKLYSSQSLLYDLMGR